MTNFLTGLFSLILCIINLNGALIHLKKDKHGWSAIFFSFALLWLLYAGYYFIAFLNGGGF